MVRAFAGEEVVHVEGDVDPIRDLEIIEEELRLKDVELLGKTLEACKKALRCAENDKTKKFELETVQKVHDWVVEKREPVRRGEWSAREVEVINPLQLLTAKNVVYLVNISREDFVSKKNRWLPKIKAWIDEKSPGDPLIPFSGEFELQVLEDNNKAAASDASALSKIILSGYRSLHLHNFFTAGADEVRAWTIRKGTKAPQAAGTIHTDFERGFIMAEVMHFEDLKAAGSENAVKAAGKYLQKGRDYTVEDGDVIFFKFNVAPQKKK